MVSNKFSSRRHIPQRPPICNPPLKKIEKLPIPPWPPILTRAQGSITYDGQTVTIDALITGIETDINEWTYWAYEENTMITYTIRTDTPSLTLYSYWAMIDYIEIEFYAEPRPLNPAVPINESYPPWIQSMGPPATGNLTITTA